MKKFAILLIVCNLASLGTAGAQTAEAVLSAAQLTRRVRAIVRPILNEYPKLDLGIAVGVIQPSGEAGGTSNLFFLGKLKDQNGAPLAFNGSTEFEIGSVTKTFTATILASLLQFQPGILLTSTNSIFPDTPSFGTSTSIGELANYTSGLPDSNRDSGSKTCAFGSGTIEDCYDLTQLFENLGNSSLTSLSFAPGSSYLYSDLGFALLALAEPQLAGESTSDPSILLQEWESMLEATVLQPLGMNGSHIFDPGMDPPLLPRGYGRKDSKDSSVSEDRVSADPATSPGKIVIEKDYKNSWPAFLGAGGIVSTPDDMMVYLQYNLGLLATPLNSLLAALHSPSTSVKTPNGDEIGLGWFINTLAGSKIPTLQKNGGVPGFSAQVDFAPSTGTGVVVLTNAAGNIVDVQRIASQTLQIINGLQPTAAGPSSDQS